MICANCNCDLTGGYQSEKNLSLCRTCEEWETQGSEDTNYLLDDAEIEPIHPDHDHDYEDNMTDAEADADTLASAGWGTDEDYGYYGDE